MNKLRIKLAVRAINWLLIIFFMGCSGNEDKKVVETYSDGSPKVIQYFSGVGVEKTMVREQIFYPDGQLRMDGEYKNGQKEGRWISYYNNGNPWSEGFYIGGKSEGKTTTWHENGKKYYEGFYKNNERSGKWTFWDEEGNLMKEIDYDAQVIESKQLGS